jgi:DNA-directed RNA polymerases I, II, and III subunit RPABC1
VVKGIRLALYALPNYSEGVTPVSDVGLFGLPLKLVAMEGAHIPEQEISRMFRIRRTILELLRDRGYIVLDNEQDLEMTRDEFSQRFIAANGSRESLTMLKQKADDPNDQIYVFFPEEAKGKSVGVKPITAKVDRMERDRIDRAIMILQTGLTPHAKQAVERLSAGQRLRMEVFFENELLVNITRHILVPTHEVMSEEDKRALLKRYKLKESQLPRIQRSDPIARYYGLVPGMVVKITRPRYVLVSFALPSRLCFFVVAYSRAQLTISSSRFLSVKLQAATSPIAIALDPVENKYIALHNYGYVTR